MKRKGESGWKICLEGGVELRLEDFFSLLVRHRWNSSGSLHASPPSVREFLDARRALATEGFERALKVCRYSPVFAESNSKIVQQSLIFF